MRNCYMSKLKHAFIVAALITAAALPSPGQTTPRVSPHDASYARLGGKLVTVYYGRPYVKNRKIWGGLVPWDKAWRIGADEATTLITQSAIVVGGVTVPAGAYTLYMIPSENGASKLAISKTIGEWGEPGDENHDLGRVESEEGGFGNPGGTTHHYPRRGRGRRRDPENCVGQGAVFRRTGRGALRVF